METVESENVGVFCDGDSSKEKSLEVLDPKHPMLARFQETLKQHLLEQIKNLKEEIHERDVEHKRVKNEEEQLGLRTYEAQQAVRKQQEALEGLVDELDSTRAAKEELDFEVKDLRKQLKIEQEHLIASQKADRDLQNDIDAINLMILQISEWQKSTESKIHIKQRISEKMKKENVRLAQEKRFQDHQIYKLNKEVWRLQSELESFNLQIKILREEEQNLAASVAIGNTNIEALTTENQNLTSSWNSVIVAIGNRDKVMETLNSEQNKSWEKLKTINTEIEQTRKMLRLTIKQNENLTGKTNNLQKTVASLKNQIEEQALKKQSGEREMAEKAPLLKQLQADLDFAKEQHKMLQNELSNKIKDHEKLVKEKIQLEQELMSKYEEHVINDKEAWLLHKELVATKNENHKLEVSLVEMENEHKQKVSLLENSQMENEELEKKLNELQEYNKNLENTLENAHKDVATSELTVKSKERQIRILSGKIEKMQKDDTVSTKTLKINALEKQNFELEENVKKMQASWLREQQNLLKISQERQQQIQSCNLYKKQILLLENKNLSLKKDLEQLNKSRDEVQRNINTLNKKLELFNEQIYKKQTCKDDLCKENEFFQMSCEGKLKDLELECLEIESKIEDLEQEKVKLSEELEGLKLEVLEWEKKVKMAKEAKENLKYEQGKTGEIALMKAEIHRMKVRYGQLKKAQEKLLVDLDHCVGRRQQIFQNKVCKKIDVKGKLEEAKKKCQFEEKPKKNLKFELPIQKKKVSIKYQTLSEITKENDLVKVTAL